MKAVILVIGIKNDECLRSAYLEVNGINPEYHEDCLISTFIAEFEYTIDAINCMNKHSEEYDYMEMKTVYKKS